MRIFARPPLTTAATALLLFFALLCPLPLSAVAAPATSAKSPKSNDPPDPPLPVIKPSAGKLVDMPTPAPATLVRHTLDGDHELLLIDVTATVMGSNARVDFSRAAGASAKTFGFVVASYGDKTAHLYARRAASEAGKALAGDLYGADFNGSGDGQRFHFELPAFSTPSDGKTRQQWFKEAARFFGQHASDSAFYAFARARMDAMNTLMSTNSDGDGRPRRAGQTEIARLMETTTGAASIQEALQSDRPLWSFTKGAKGTVPIASLNGPKLATHPFAAMLKALGAAADQAPVEALAASVPADFYFLRFHDLNVLFRLVDAADAWGTPITNALDSRAEDRKLADRYLTQLGLSRSGLARTLGTSVIGELAVVGSDPYVREGTDLTFLFRVKQKALFDGALASALAAHATAHGALTASDHTVGDVTVHSQRSADGAVRQERATLGDIELVSNSPGAIARVLAAASGRAPRLSDEPDFRYLLARDAATPADGLAFLGDRFVAAVVGPAQKILEARRQLALAALSRPGYAALLYGWLEGQSPSSVADLIKSGWLDATDLATPDGAKIDFTVGQAVRSAWGSPAALTPLIDLPQLTTVTADEKAGYESFTSSYEGYWRYYMDPIALRIALAPAGGDTRMTLDLRVLPLIDGTEFRDIIRTAGDARVTVPELPSGVRWVVGVGKTARLREELSGLIGNVMGQRVQFDWLGDWTVFGVEDRTPVAVLLRNRLGRGLTAGGARSSPSDDFDDVLRTPFYVGIGLRSPAGAAIFLTAGRSLVMSAAPGLVSWEPYSVHKNAHIVRIHVDAKNELRVPAFNLYYTVTSNAFYASFSEATLDRLIDGGQIASAPTGSQLVVDAATKAGQALYTVGAWVLEMGVMEATSHVGALAEQLFRGAPETVSDPAEFVRVAQAYEGAVPVSPDGGTFSYGPDGVQDSIRGTAFAMRWPALPVPNSPVARLLAAVSRFHGELAFDQEVDVKLPPPTDGSSDDHSGDGSGDPGDARRMRSLHGRASFVIH